MKSIMSMLNKDKYWLFVGWSLFGIAIGFTIASVINFQNQLYNQSLTSLPIGLNLLPEGMFDSLKIFALSQISRLVPQNETIVVSDNRPLSEYFTKHNAEIPRGAYSEKSLLDYMSKNKYDYLLVYEGASEVEELIPLFTTGGLEKLKSHYNEIANYTTEYSNIHLYQRKL